MARALLLQYNSYLPLWAHAMVYATMIYNSSLSTRLNMTRYEAFHGKIPDVSRFRTFGCRVYARVHDTPRKKLDPKSQIGIYLHPEVSGPGHKIMVFDPNLKGENRYAVHIVRDVVTFESWTNVAGVQDYAKLHWGGQFHCPHPMHCPISPSLWRFLLGIPLLHRNTLCWTTKESLTLALDRELMPHTGV